jgi:hypothetical protein
VTSPAPHALVDVPYVAQPQELCGAAAAMVLGYWGERNVFFFPQDFCTLSRDASGAELSLVAATEEPP